jgi:hypothetical protein
LTDALAVVRQAREQNQRAFVQIYKLAACPICYGLSAAQRKPNSPPTNALIF